MQTKVKDDRDNKQKQTHTTLIVGTDRFMSGWGDATGGTSYAAWACTSEDEKTVLEWVESRQDMQRVRVVYDTPAAPYRPNPRHCIHIHIYVVKPNHPAVERKNSFTLSDAVRSFFYAPSPLAC